MTVDSSTFQWIVTGLLGLIMWFGKRTVDGMQAQIVALELDNTSIRNSYIHKDNFKEFKDEFRELLKEIKQDIKDIKGAK